MTSTMTAAGAARESIMLNFQDRKDLEKYTRHLTYKVVQVIVQSRFGEKTKCHAKPDRSEWFNLAIDDVKEVHAEASKSFNSEVPCLDGLGVNVEVSVRTVDGDRMVLEIWSLNLNDQLRDSNVHITHTVYNRMGLLLKSLISVTRITPAYRFSREQGPECFVICYRIYVGESQVQCLGEEYENIKVGQVGTPLGTLTLNVLYRTKLTITPHKIKKVGSFMMLNSDYFIPEEICETRKNGHVVTNGCHNNLDRIKPQPNKTVNSSSSSSGGTLSNGLMEKSAESVDKDELFLKSKRIGAFASSLNNGKIPEKADNEPNYIPEAPFISLLSRHLKNCAENEQNCDNINNKNLYINGKDKMSNGHELHNNNGPDNKEKFQSKKNIRNGFVYGDEKSGNSDEDDFVLVELKTPFAGHHMKNELAEFFRECRAAPSLQSFTEDQPTLEEQFDQLNDQFAGFELDMQEYDSFVQSLCADEGID